MSFKAMCAYISDDTDDGEPVVIMAPAILAFESFADGVLTRPITMSRARINYCDQGCVWAVQVREIAPSQKLRSYCLKIIASNSIPGESSPLFGRLGDMTFNNAQSQIVCGSELEKAIDRPGILYTWDFLEPGNNGIKQGGRPTGTDIGEGDVHG